MNQAPLAISEFGPPYHASWDVILSPPPPRKRRRVFSRVEIVRIEACLSTFGTFQVVQKLHDLHCSTTYNPKIHLHRYRHRSYGKWMLRREGRKKYPMKRHATSRVADELPHPSNIRILTHHSWLDDSREMCPVVEAFHYGVLAIKHDVTIRLVIILSNGQGDARVVCIHLEMYEEVDCNKFQAWEQGVQDLDRAKEGRSKLCNWVKYNLSDYNKVTSPQMVSSKLSK